MEQIGSTRDVKGAGVGQRDEGEQDLHVVAQLRRETGGECSESLIGRATGEDDLDGEVVHPNLRRVSAGTDHLAVHAVNASGRRFGDAERACGAHQCVVPWSGNGCQEAIRRDARWKSAGRPNAQYLRAVVDHDRVGRTVIAVSQRVRDRLVDGNLREVRDGEFLTVR